MNHLIESIVDARSSIRPRATCNTIPIQARSYAGSDAQQYFLRVAIEANCIRAKQNYHSSHRDLL